VPDTVEIHTVWRPVDKPKAGEPSRRPVRHQSGRALWRGGSGLLGYGGAGGEAGLNTSTMLGQLADLADGVLPEEFPLGVLAVGVEYGNQSAVVENVYVDEIPMPVRAFGAGSEVAEVLRECARQAEELRMALNTL